MRHGDAGNTRGDLSGNLLTGKKHVHLLTPCRTTESHYFG